MDDDFLFAGYQARVVEGLKPTYTLGDNINPLYVPNRESIRSHFELIMEECEIPFLITRKSNLLKVIDLSLHDLPRPENLFVFRCAILKSDSRSGKCEFYNGAGDLVTASFMYVDELVEPEMKFEHYGYDVIDSTIGGGFDSAIHTYNLPTVTLNESGLLTEENTAIDLRNYAQNELPDHGPFSVWSVGLVNLDVDV
ncbi:MAG: hypothetical protein GY820_06165 [Gammaproteobacteria bacterium]|nr:hypothetical protein [Gammaproteobacteria bacterium]